MERSHCTEAILEARAERGLSFVELAETVGRSEVWAAAAILGQAQMDAQEAGALATSLGLGPDVTAALQEDPMRGSLDGAVPAPVGVVARPLVVSFRAGDAGAWRIDSVDPVIGEGLAAAQRLEVVEGDAAQSPIGLWVLNGVTSNERYVERPERVALTAVQEGLGRPEATCAALIPIRKSDAWWMLPQDERRAILEQRSHHIAVGLEYLPAVARRLHHSRDLGEDFDFLTWFEFAPTASQASMSWWPAYVAPRSGPTWSARSTSA